MNCKSAFFGILSFFVVSIIALIYVTLGWSDLSFMSKDELQNRYLIKEDISFYDLPEDTQNLYMHKDSVPKAKTVTKTVTKTVVKEDTKKIDSLMKQNDQLKSNIAKLQDQLSKSPELEEDTKENFALYKNKPVKTLRCSGFADNKYLVTKECANKIEKFLNSYAKPAHFEIISMIDKTDFHNFKTKNKNDRINKLLDEGLAKLRAKEVGWYIRQRAKSGSFYSFPPYQFKTDETKGVVINVY